MPDEDDSAKTLPETLITILEPCEVPLAFDYHNRTFDVRPIATALLQWGYGPDSLARDLWKRTTDSRQKIEILKKLLRPCDARMVLPSPESGFVPRRARTWQEVRSKFLQSDDLRASVVSWTRDFYLDLLLTIMARSHTPTPSDRSMSTRNQDFQAQVIQSGWRCISDRESIGYAIISTSAWHDLFHKSNSPRSAYYSLQREQSPGAAKGAFYICRSIFRDPVD